jgi:CheY-like chemotaxis protein
VAIQNILIVDDSPTERYYLTDILVRNGFPSAPPRMARKRWPRSAPNVRS